MAVREKEMAELRALLASQITVRRTKSPRQRSPERYTTQQSTDRGPISQSGSKSTPPQQEEERVFTVEVKMATP
jgi:hypothetical protein